MFIPFEPVIPFTVGSLIVWYLLMLMCASGGALGGILGKTITYTRMVVGSLCGIGFYYALSWLFQSRASMEFHRIFDTIL